MLQSFHFRRVKVLCFWATPRRTENASHQKKGAFQGLEWGGGRVGCSLPAIKVMTCFRCEERRSVLTKPSEYATRNGVEGFGRELERSDSEVKHSIKNLILEIQTFPLIPNSSFSFTLSFTYTSYIRSLLLHILQCD